MKRVVIVILDGLRRDLVTAAHAPSLASFRARAEDFGAHRSVFPSATRVVSASFATGCHPARHGRQGNSVRAARGRQFVRHDAGGPDFLQHKRRVTGTALAAPTLAELLDGTGALMLCLHHRDAIFGANYERDRTMKVVTLRNLSPALARAIRRKADVTRSSISKTVIALLEESVGITRRRREERVHHDLDDLSGVWTRDEAALFEKALKAQRTIDAELWQR